jgi:hypothetical protein
LDAWEVRCASSRTSAATTAKPRPASPARAASTAAFSASRFVCDAISRIHAHDLADPGRRGLDPRHGIDRRRGNLTALLRRPPRLSGKVAGLLGIRRRPLQGDGQFPGRSGHFREIRRLLFRARGQILRAISQARCRAADGIHALDSLPDDFRQLVRGGVGVLLQLQQVAIELAADPDSEIAAGDGRHHADDFAECGGGRFRPPVDAFGDSALEARDIRQVDTA